MATMKEVASVWEKRHPSLKLKEISDDMTKLPFFEKPYLNEAHYEIKIKTNFFSLGFHIEREKWFERNGNKDNLSKFLDKEIKNFISDKETIKILIGSRTYPIFFDIRFKLNKTAEDICDYLEEFIALTYRGIKEHIGKENETPITLDFDSR
jgi:hypothetical protein